MNVSSASHARFKIKFEIAEVLPDFDHVSQCGIAQRRAAQICMEYHAGRIDYRAKRVLSMQCEALSHHIWQLINAFLQAALRVPAGGYFEAQVGKGVASREQQRVARI